MTPIPSSLSDAALVASGAFALYVVFRHRRRGVGLHVTLLSVGAVALVAASLFRGEVFDTPGAALVEQTGLPEAFRALDAEIDALQELPADTFSSLLDRFGWAEQTPPEPEPTGPGLVESTLLPYVEALVTLGLRALALVTGSLSFLLAVVWAAASGYSTRRMRLAARVEALERRLGANGPAGTGQDGGEHA